MKETVECNLCKKQILINIKKYNKNFIFHATCFDYIKRIAKRKNLTVDELLEKYYGK